MQKRAGFFVSLITVCIIIVGIASYLMLDTQAQPISQGRIYYLGQLIKAQPNWSFVFGGITYYNGEYTLTLCEHQGSWGGANMFVHITKGQILHLSDWQFRIIDFDQKGDWIQLQSL